MSKAYKKIHIITGLSIGGAETFLYRYLLSCPSDEIKNQAVFSLTGEGYYGGKITDIGINVFFIEKNSGITSFILSFLKFLINIFHGSKGAVAVFWMYHPMLLSPLFKWRTSSIIWAVRRSLDGLETMKKSTRLVLALCKIFSKHIPNKILYNSYSGLTSHEKYGFHDKNSHCIHNGVDTNLFKRELKKRIEGRSKLGIPDTAKVVAFIGRLEPVKGPDILKSVINRVISMSNVFFIIIGRENKDFNFQYLTEGLDENLKKKIIMLGQRNDVPELLSVADYMLSCSYCEGFPNAIAESMAASLVPIVTDVGDSRFLVGESGGVCPPGDHEELSFQLKKYILNEDLTRISSIEARNRVLGNFSFKINKTKLDTLFS